jgi:HEAT repeat protein
MIATRRGRRGSVFLAATTILFASALLHAGGAPSALGAPAAVTAPSVDAVELRDQAALATLVTNGDYEALRALGPAVMAPLAQLYRGYQLDDDPAARERVAWAFYRLGFPSEEAASALLTDVEGIAEPPGGAVEGGVVDDAHERLLISAQYALGRVGGDETIVQVLLRNMRHGRSLLLRDKAACALAYDQIHLTPAQKVLLFRGLIASLADPKLDVRRIAILALRIHTGQTKGFDPRGNPETRQAAIEAWFQWLSEYAAQL